MLSADTRTGFCPRDGAAASLKPFLKAFGDFMRKQPGLRDFPKVPAVKELLAVSDPQIGAELEDELDYMPLDDFNPIRRAVKPLKDAGAAAPASPGKGDGRLLGAPPPKREPIFWT